MVAHRRLPFQFDPDTSCGGLTASGGVSLFLELMATLDLPDEVGEHIELRPTQGWGDIQHVVCAVLLNLVGGGCVEDIAMLEADKGLCRVIERIEDHRVRPELRARLAARFRRKSTRAFPSPSALSRWLDDFVSDRPDKGPRGPQSAFVPHPSEALDGLRGLVAKVAGWEQLWPADMDTATLDLDACLVPSDNRCASHCYKGFRGFQPLNVYWAEKAQMLRSGFRAGHCPASWRNLEVLKEALEDLPERVEDVRFRADTASYQTDLLKFLAEGHHPRFGSIPFAIGVPVTPAFRQAVANVEADQWLRLEDGRQIAEVNFVPNWVGHTKRGPSYRYMAVRRTLEEPDGRDVDQLQEDLPFPVAQSADGQLYKLFGVVTNRHEMDADTLIDWHYGRCGHAERVHGVIKSELAGGHMPSSDNLQANAAWWQLSLLALNLQRLLARDVLPDDKPTQMMKTFRLRYLFVAAKVVKHARRLKIRIQADHPNLESIQEARSRLVILRRWPPTPWLKSA
jgi:hypothetical protein